MQVDYRVDARRALAHAPSEAVPPASRKNESTVCGAGSRHDVLRPRPAHPGVGLEEVSIRSDR
jgi:hypothetical protein